MLKIHTFTYERMERRSSVNAVAVSRQAASWFVCTLRVETIFFVPRSRASAPKEVYCSKFPAETKSANEGATQFVKSQLHDQRTSC